MASGRGGAESYPVGIDVLTDPVVARGHRGAALRITPWHGEPHVAQLVAVAGPGPTVDELAEVVDGLEGQGIRRLVTSALTTVDQQAYRSAGFVDHEHLLLLHRPLHRSGAVGCNRPASGYLVGWFASKTRPVRAGDREDVLAVDRQAFAHASAVWRTDRAALADAVRATDEHRWRLVRRSPATTGPAGHALTGRTGTSGFIQRLAVHPAAEGRGVGSMLVADALRWLVRSGARHAFVNTQPDNHRARTLYERHGFTVLPDGLDVLRLDLRGTP